MIGEGKLFLHGWAGNGDVCTVSVQVEHRCVLCQATGKVYSQAWAEWNAVFDLRQKDLGQPFHLWPEELKLDFDATNPQPEESEEHLCPDCDGKGVQLTRDGQALIDFITRHLRREP